MTTNDIRERMTRKKSILVGATILVAGIITTVVVMKPWCKDAQRLPDGSLLVLNRVSIAGTNEFVHGRLLEKAFNKLIPAKGVEVFGFKLSKPKSQTFTSPPGKSQLAVEFKLVSDDPANHPLVKPAFYREFRCMIRGENGIEYAQQFWPSGFQSYPDGYFASVVTSRFPRDSRWLWFRIERREREDQGGPWTLMTEFKIKNPQIASIKDWVPDQIGVTKTVEGMDFTLGQITVVTQAYGERDIWNHIVTTPFRIESNGIALTNWSAPYVRVEDASGNWDNLMTWRSLDPRYVWKLEADFQPVSEFPPESLTTVKLSGRSLTITTNVMNVPVTISWDWGWIDASMATNRSDLALRFVCVVDEQGDQTSDSSGSWGQHRFRKGDFYIQRDGVASFDFKPTSVTFAVVPNVRLEFLTQPRLVTTESED